MSAPRRGGLGRGLGALIPGGPVQALERPVDLTAPSEDLRVEQVPGARFAELPVEAIAPNAAQPRTNFDPDELAELVGSIREVGLLQPVVVRPAGPGRYELVMGERRLRAAKEAGLTTIPAIVRETSDDAMLRDALLENLHRSQLNPLEEAAAYAQLLQDFGTTQEELAHRIGRSRPQISNTLRLLGLPAPVQRRVAAGVLSAGHARAILGLADAEAMEAMAGRIVAEGMSVRVVEEAVAMQQPGAGARRPARSSRPSVPAAAAELIDQVSEKLGDRLDTRVTVDVGRAKGKVTIEFGSLDDLQRIVAVIAPDPNFF